jgi:hypothetical protein
MPVFLPYLFGCLRNFSIVTARGVGGNLLNVGFAMAAPDLAFHRDKFHGLALLNCPLALLRWPLKRSVHRDVEAVKKLSIVASELRE